MKKSLYNIEKEYLDIANQLEDGELSEELEQALTINQAELQGKAVAYAYVIKESDDTVSAIDAELRYVPERHQRSCARSGRLEGR